MTKMWLAGQFNVLFDNGKGSGGPTAITKLMNSNGKPDYYLLNIAALGIVDQVLRFNDIDPTYAENKGG